MASYNRVILMGNLTRDPEVRQTQSGTFLARTGLAVNERMPDGQGGWKEQANFFDIVIFGRQAESFGKWFQKGRPCLIEGKLRQNTWEDQSSGQKRSKVEVIVDRWHFVGGREGREGGGGDRGSEPAGAQAAADFPGSDDFRPDDVPF